MLIVVGPEQAGQRLDAVIKYCLADVSRAKIQKAIKEGYCEISGELLKNPAYKVRESQLIKIDFPEVESRLKPMHGELKIVWQDNDLAVCAKPANLVVHPCPSYEEETLAHRLLARFPQLANQPAARPGIVHRLDKDTSGLLLVALSEKARLKLTDAFAERKIKKEYLALVAGVAPEIGKCEEAIGRHPTVKTKMAIIPENAGGRPAYTEWRRLWHNQDISLLRVVIHTGRTHQIRVHLAHCGLPILGDSTYAPASVARLASRQMLHAWRLELKHPITDDELKFCLPPPADFFETIETLPKKMLKIVVTGNQGCGKSSFCKALAAQGLPVISADQIVADLYAHKSAATDWISTWLGTEAINPDGSVNKSVLFELLQKKPEIRREFETAIHGLVLDEIERFWEKHADNVATVAEIPLYFESNFQKKITPEPFVVGISCPKNIRWQRIAENRGWSEDKIEALESWQWPEAKKMAACNAVIANTGPEKDLINAASRLISGLETKRRAERHQLIAEIEKLCACEHNLREGKNTAIEKTDLDTQK